MNLASTRPSWSSIPHSDHPQPKESISRLRSLTASLWRRNGDAPASPSATPYSATPGASSSKSSAIPRPAAIKKPSSSNIFAASKFRAKSVSSKPSPTSSTTSAPQVSIFTAYDHYDDHEQGPSDPFARHQSPPSPSDATTTTSFAYGPKGPISPLSPTSPRRGRSVTVGNPQPRPVPPPSNHETAKSRKGNGKGQDKHKVENTLSKTPDPNIPYSDLRPVTSRAAHPAHHGDWETPLKSDPESRHRLLSLPLASSGTQVLTSISSKLNAGSSAAPRRPPRHNRHQSSGGISNIQDLTNVPLLLDEAPPPFSNPTFMTSSLSFSSDVEDDSFIDLGRHPMPRLPAIWTNNTQSKTSDYPSSSSSPAEMTFAPSGPPFQRSPVCTRDDDDDDEDSLRIPISLPVTHSDFLDFPVAPPLMQQPPPPIRPSRSPRRELTNPLLDYAGYGPRRAPVIRKASSSSLLEVADIDLRLSTPEVLAHVPSPRASSSFHQRRPSVDARRPRALSKKRSTTDIFEAPTSPSKAGHSWRRPFGHQPGQSSISPSSPIEPATSPLPRRLSANTSPLLRPQRSFGGFGATGDVFGTLAPPALYQQDESPSSVSISSLGLHAISGGSASASSTSLVSTAAQGRHGSLVQYHRPGIRGEESRRPQTGSAQWPHRLVNAEFGLRKHVSRPSTSPHPSVSMFNHDEIALPKSPRRPVLHIRPSLGKMPSTSALQSPDGNVIHNSIPSPPQSARHDAGYDVIMSPRLIPTTMIEPVPNDDPSERSEIGQHIMSPEDVGRVFEQTTQELRLRHQHRDRVQNKPAQPRPFGGLGNPRDTKGPGLRPGRSSSLRAPGPRANLSARPGTASSSRNLGSGFMFSPSPNSLSNSPRSNHSSSSGPLGRQVQSLGRTALRRPTTGSGLMLPHYPHASPGSHIGDYSTHSLPPPPRSRIPRSSSGPVPLALRSSVATSDLNLMPELGASIVEEVSPVLSNIPSSTIGSSTASPKTTQSAPPTIQTDAGGDTLSLLSALPPPSSSAQLSPGMTRSRKVSTLTFRSPDNGAYEQGTNSIASPTPPPSASRPPRQITRQLSFLDLNDDSEVEARPGTLDLFLSESEDEEYE